MKPDSESEEASEFDEGEIEVEPSTMQLFIFSPFGFQAAKGFEKATKMSENCTAPCLRCGLRFCVNLKIDHYNGHRPYCAEIEVRNKK